MPFGEWYCVICQKTLQLGTVAPRTAMHRHLDSARHRKLAAEQATKKVENPPLMLTSQPPKEQPAGRVNPALLDAMRKNRDLLPEPKPKEQP